MQKQNKTAVMVLGLVFVAIVLCSVLARTVKAQDPAPTPPVMPQVEMNCVSDPPGFHAKFRYSSDPMNFFQALFQQASLFPDASSSTDKTKPIITDVKYSGGGTVLTDAVKIPGNSVSVQFAVSAVDDVGVQTFMLYVDGYIAEQGPAMNYPHYLPGTFAVRWNDGSIFSGWHDFKLVVLDQASNQSEVKTWRMFR